MGQYPPIGRLVVDDDWIGENIALAITPAVGIERVGGDGFGDRHAPLFEDPDEDVNCLKIVVRAYCSLRIRWSHDGGRKAVEVHQ